MKAISLGWGVQSFAMAAMAALGELESVDVAIHSDTTHERSGTYAFAEKWTPWLEERGVKVVTVEDAPKGQIDKWSGLFIPAYTISEQPEIELILDEVTDEVIEWRRTGSLERVNGQLRRQCTGRWKITPMRRWLQKHRDKQPIEMWLGISTDEALRMKPSDVKYITNRWPLVEQRMSRFDCMSWLERNGLEIPVRSSCVFCPYHDTRSWQEIKQDTNGDWQKAVDVDQAIRKARPPYDLFVHPARVPLVDVDLRTEREKGQLSLWDEECEGVCGV